MPVEDPRTHRLLRALTEEMGVRDDVALLATPDDTTPMTFGWRRPVSVLTAVLLDDEQALRLTLLHELIHIRRRDYAVSWVVRLVSGLFAIHPGVWLLHRRIDQYREISCDAETLGQTTEGAGAYARLLVRFSPLYDLAGPAALRMAKLDSTLKKRINAMHHTLRFTSSLRLRRWSLPLAALLLLIPALLAACATENTTSETVIVTVGSEDAEHQKFVHGEQLEMTQQFTDELIRREKLERQENRRAFDEAVEQMRIHETFEQMNQSKLERLELQMAYLKDQIKKAAGAAERLEQADREGKSEVTRYEYMMVRRRIELLNAMHMERLEKFETMKMEQFTEAALRERSSEE